MRNGLIHLIGTINRPSVDDVGSLALDALLDLAEMGAPQGLVGTVTGIAAAPEVERGPGRVVVTTVNHLNGFVFELTLKNAAGEAETLGVTGWHKFYDEAEGWQSVCELTVGDTLRGKEGELVTVASVVRDPGVRRVYNVTVEADHVYFVGDLTTLTHNTKCTSWHSDQLGKTWLPPDLLNRQDYIRPRI